MKKTLFKKRTEPINRISALIFFTFFCTGIIGMRLFYFQIIKYDFYESKAAKQHYRQSEQDARRGEIFIKDYASNDNVRVATNITLDTLFADQKTLVNEKLVADRIAPIIFDEEEAKKEDELRIKSELKKAKTAEEAEKIKPLTTAELEQKFHDQIFEKISKKVPAEVILHDSLAKETLKAIEKLGLPGIRTTEKELIAYPIQMGDQKKIAETLSTYLEVPPAVIENDLQGLNRYVILKKKLKPEISAQIRKIIEDDRLLPAKNRNFAGLGLESNYYRYYPENQLASNILGFVGQDNVGAYGIESNYNTELQGKKGIFKSQRDSSGRQITVGDVVIESAVNGSNVVLTIDRSIQNQVEKLLAKYVKDLRADNGQVIVMEPKTGRIMAMANYPTFNPNSYSDVSNEKEEIKLRDDQIQNLKQIDEKGNVFFYTPPDQAEGPAMAIFKEQNADGSIMYKKYKNTFGPEAYQNKNISDAYEPGSVFKVITMASALEDGDVKPTTTVTNPAVLELDWNAGRKDFDAKIHDVAANQCFGRVTMSWILQNSCNTGISQVALKMGTKLFYNYLLKFGFNQKTEIEFDNESAGKVLSKIEADGEIHWTDGELANHSFGQGFLVTPLQMVTSYATIANKGIMMQPHIVDSIISADGKVTVTEPEILRRVLSEKTASIISGMLVNNVENGDSYQRYITMKDHYIGAKTGTAQTLKGNKYVDGVGKTITTVVGYAPIDDPKFVILARITRPRTNQWADSTAAIVFNKTAEYLFDYFSIPPDKV